MNFITTTYTEYIKQIPITGRHILAQQTVEKILVYQAFRPAIATYAIEQQKFGGPHYSYTRMSWIKPNFLWMMYRAGWATKSGQEKILGIWLKKIKFDKILANSVFTSYDSHVYSSHDMWKQSLEKYPVRLQWDPDHSPFGEKEKRKAIQLGIKGELLHEFGKEMVCEIMDMTDFVTQQRRHIDNKDLSKLLVPTESIYLPESETVQAQIGLQ